MPKTTTKPTKGKKPKAKKEPIILRGDYTVEIECEIQIEITDPTYNPDQFAEDAAEGKISRDPYTYDKETRREGVNYCDEGNTRRIGWMMVSAYDSIEGTIGDELDQVDFGE